MALSPFRSTRPLTAWRLNTSIKACLWEVLMVYLFLSGSLSLSMSLIFKSLKTASCTLQTVWSQCPDGTGSRNVGPGAPACRPTQLPWSSIPQCSSQTPRKSTSFPLPVVSQIRIHTSWPALAERWDYYWVRWERYRRRYCRLLKRFPKFMSFPEPLSRHFSLSEEILRDRVFLFPVVDSHDICDPHNSSVLVASFCTNVQHCHS